MRRVILHPEVESTQDEPTRAEPSVIRKLPSSSMETIKMVSLEARIGIPGCLEGDSLVLFEWTETSSTDP